MPLRKTATLLPILTTAWKRGVLLVFFIGFMLPAAQLHAEEIFSARFDRDSKGWEWGHWEGKPEEGTWCPQEGKTASGSLLLVGQSERDNQAWMKRHPSLRLNVKEGARYRVSVEVKTHQVTGAADILVLFYSVDNTELGRSFKRSKRHLFGDNGWTKLVVAATAPAKAKTMRINLTIRGKGKAWFDDVAVEERIEGPQFSEQDYNIRYVESGETLFEAIRPTALEEIRITNALLQADYAQARSRLVDHFRTRNKPRTEIGTAHDYQNAEAYAANLRRIWGPGSIQANTATAKRYLSGEAFERFRKDGKIRWRDFDPGTLETNADLQRMFFLPPLGRELCLTKDERYAGVLMRVFKDWFASCPAAGTVSEQFYDHNIPGWRELDAALRMKHLIEVFFCALYSNRVNDEDLILLLRSIHQHATYLTAHFQAYGVFPGNHQNFHAYPLLQAGILFPEFKDCPKWRQVALDILEGHLKCDFNSDGGHTEASPGYHFSMAETYLLSMELAALNDVKLPKGLFKDTEKMFEYLLYVCTPDGLTDDIHDSFRYDSKHVMNRAAKFFHRDEFAVFTSSSIPKKMPAPSRVFPQTGIAVLRGNWSRQTPWLLLDATRSQPPGHWHAGKLGFDLMFAARHLAGDSGSANYDLSETNEWFRRHRAHSTVQVDGKEDATFLGAYRWRDMPNPRIDQWHDSNVCGYLEATSDGYKRLEAPVSHTRKVVFVRPNYFLIYDKSGSESPHLYEWLIHFEPNRLKIDRESGRIVTSYPTLHQMGISRYAFGADCNANLLVKVADPGDLDAIEQQEGLMGRHLEKAPYISLIKKKRENAEFVVLLMPFFSKDAPKVDVKLIRGAKGLAVEVIHPSGKDYILFGAEDNSTVNLGDFKLKGRFAVVRKDKKGKIIAADFQSGTFLWEKSEAVKTAKPKTYPSGMNLPQLLPSSLIVEGENFTDEGNGQVDICSRLGASGKIIRNWDNKGHWIEWEIEAKKACRYKLVVRYAAKDRPEREIILNGLSSGQLEFAPTGGWSSWNYQSLESKALGKGKCFILGEGKNVLRMVNVNGVGMNIDSILLVPE